MTLKDLKNKKRPFLNLYELFKYKLHSIPSMLNVFQPFYCLSFQLAGNYRYIKQIYMCAMTKFAKPKQYMETFQFVQVDILKYKRYPSAFGFNKPLTQFRHNYKSFKFQNISYQKYTEKYKYIHYLSQPPTTHKSSNFKIAATKKI